MPNLHKLFFIVFFGLFSVLTATTITSFQTGYWDVTSTWVGGAIPTPADDVIIANGHTVTVPAYNTSEMKNLTIDGGATLDASNYSTKIIVKGNWLNNGDFIKSGSGRVTFSSGAADQSVNPGGDTFPNLFLSNNGYSITISDHIDIDGDLELTHGTLDLNADDKNVNISGDVEISDNAIWTSGDGTVTFDGNEQEFTDLNTTANNIGIIVVDEP